MLTAKGGQKGFRVNVKTVEDFLGAPKFKVNQVDQTEQIGVTNGLAWTDTGGDMLAIEVTIVPGKGSLKITGKLGDVMQESAHAAMSYVRSIATDLGLKKDFYQAIDIHIHVPEGAIPKDGPSAGITIATSLASALTQIPVRQDVAMTGEITLRGRVLPIGGLKEKVLASKRAGIKRILIPKDNEADLKELPKGLLKDIEVFPLETTDQVLSHALSVDSPATIFKGRKPARPQDKRRRPGVDSVIHH
jgi:ATP-dependent Lon protease